MTLVLGVDPGTNGALALIETAERRILTIADIATFVIADGKRKTLDAAKIEPWLFNHEIRAARPPAIVEVVEVIRAGPRISGSATLTAGRIAGALEAELHRLGFPLSYVTATQWKRRAGLLKQPKDASLGKAKLTFGTSAGSWFDRKKDHDRAEAALIALYGRA